MNMSVTSLFKTIACVTCLAAAPFAVAAQETPSSDALIDVFQDGTLFITYDEYLDRQRRVLAARSANQTVAPATVPPRRAPATPQVARSSSQMELRGQWQIGAFR